MLIRNSGYASRPSGPARSLLTMRRVADRLGVGAMSLYRYVPFKAELVDLMVDRVSGQTDRRPVSGGWRARLERIAWENRRLYERHPWLLQVFPGRPPLGPGVLEKYERELSPLEGVAARP
ncbi:MAG: TetR/AcrR family transcriptional regulator [Gaiellaceae bacterium]